MNFDNFNHRLLALVLLNTKTVRELRLLAVYGMHLANGTEAPRYVIHGAQSAFDGVRYAHYQDAWRFAPADVLNAIEEETCKQVYELAPHFTELAVRS